MDKKVEVPEPNWWIPRPKRSSGREVTYGRAPDDDDAISEVDDEDDVEGCITLRPSRLMDRVR
mgnify:CR=1 FL=1